MIRLLVLVASHNRREKTLACLTSLHFSLSRQNIKVDVFLCDAGSTDGTVEAVSRSFPSTHVLHASPQLFWADAMRKAWEHSRGCEVDYVLWLNDDVVLDADALGVLVTVAQDLNDHAIVVGSTRGLEGTDVTYGGYRRGPWYRRLSLSRVSPSQSAQRVELGNGNILLVSRKVDLLLGGFPQGYGHSMADLVFTHRANTRKIPVIVSPGTLGVCQENPTRGTWKDPTFSFSQRWVLLNSPKGLPIRSWLKLCFLLGGVSAPLYVFKPWWTVIWDSASSRLRRS